MDISSGKKRKRRDELQVDQKGTQVLCHAGPPSAHDRQIPAERNSTPETTISRQNQLQSQNAIHTAHAWHVLRSSGPPADREMGHFAVLRQKNTFVKKHKISLYGQCVINLFFRLMTKRVRTETHKCHSKLQSLSKHVHGSKHKLRKN